MASALPMEDFQGSCGYHTPNWVFHGKLKIRQLNWVNDVDGRVAGEKGGSEAKRDVKLVR